MDHRDIIADLTPEQRSHLTGKSNAAGLLHLGAHWGLIGILGSLIAIRAPYWPLLILPQGLLIIFLFTLLHESVHKTPFESPWINDWVGRVCGFLILLPPEWFRFFHFAHHRFTQDPENDPELKFAKPDTLRQYIWHVSGIPVWHGDVMQLLHNALGGSAESYVPVKGRNKVRTEARIMLALYAALCALSIYFRSPVLLYVWIIPAIIGQPFLRLYLLAEHGRCPFVANMLDNSRTTYTNWLVRKLAWNMPFHAEHHSYPGVPFYRLPEFHEVIKERIGTLEHGYVRFHRNYLKELG